MKGQRELSSFKKLTNHEYTVGKVSKKMNISPELSLKILMKYVKIGILEISFGIRCSRCGLLIKRFEKLEDVSQNKKEYCYLCNESFKIKKENIEILYKLIN